MAKKDKKKEEPQAETTPEPTAEAEQPVKRRGRGAYVKNWIGQPGAEAVEGQKTPAFKITDAESISAFIAAYGNMGEGWPKAGYETHFNDCGPLQRCGVVRMTNQGKAKIVAVFLDALAEDASLAGTTAEIEPGHSPEEAEGLLASISDYINDLIERKRAEREERTLAAAAKAAGVPIEKLKALRDKEAKAAAVA